MRKNLLAWCLALAVAVCGLVGCGGGGSDGGGGGGNTNDYVLAGNGALIGFWQSRSEYFWNLDIQVDGEITLFAGDCEEYGLWYTNPTKITIDIYATNGSDNCGTPITQVWDYDIINASLIQITDEKPEVWLLDN